MAKQRMIVAVGTLGPEIHHRLGRDDPDPTPEQLEEYRQTLIPVGGVRPVVRVIPRSIQPDPDTPEAA
jgi:hypothetical protein